MSTSLNAYDREIIYDTNVDYYIDKYKFAGELVFSFRFPEILHHISDCYCVDAEAESFELDCLKDNRKVVIAGTRNWITRKDAKGKDCIDVYTSMVIAIEIKYNELENVKALFSDEESTLKANVCTLLQNALEIALYRYNEKAGGSSFLTPSLNIVDRIELTLYKNYVEKRFRCCNYRSYEFKLAKDTEYPIMADKFQEPVENWRYFYNKSVYELKNKQYLDSIISAAISIETYSWGTLKKVLIEEEKIEDFATEEVDGEKKHLSATRLYKKLIDQGILKSTLSKSKMESKIQKVLDPRNDIMHGKRSVVGAWKSEAEIANKEIQELFGSFGEDVSPELFLEKNNQNGVIDEYRKYVLKSKEDGVPANDILSLAEKANRDFPDMELPKINIILALFMLGRTESAMERVRELMAESKNQSAIAVDLLIRMCKLPNLLDNTKKIMNLVEEKDERALAFIGFIIMECYNASGKKDKKLLVTALNNLTESNRKNYKYVLSKVLTCQVLEELGSEERFKYYKVFVEDFVYDFGFPLKCAEHALSLGDINETVHYMDIFIERFEKYHLTGIMIDFYLLSNDLANINNRVESIINVLQKNAEITGWLKNMEITFNKYRTVVLGPEIMFVDKISAFNKGEMPKGNIILGNPLDIIAGYVLFE